MKIRHATTRKDPITHLSGGDSPYADKVHIEAHSGTNYKRLCPASAYLVACIYDSGSISILQKEYSLLPFGKPTIIGTILILKPSASFFHASYYTNSKTLSVETLTLHNA